MAALVHALVTVARPKVLLAVASHIEAKAIRGALAIADPIATSPAVSDSPWRLESLGPHADLVVTGVGKVNAAAGVAATLAPAHVGVISLGIAGILPHDSASNGTLSLCDVVVASAMRYPDEGKLTPEGFQSLAQLGFPHGPFDEGMGVAATPAWARTLHDRLVVLLRTRADGRLINGAPSVHSGPIATVSTCSATDALAREVARRTGAIAEGMEGAAACQVAAWHALAFAEVRVLSNTTGDRARQQWDMKGSLAMLGRVAAAICR